MSCLGDVPLSHCSSCFLLAHFFSLYPLIVCVDLTTPGLHPPPPAPSPTVCMTWAWGSVLPPSDHEYWCHVGKGHRFIQQVQAWELGWNTLQRDNLFLLGLLNCSHVSGSASPHVGFPQEIPSDKERNGKAEPEDEKKKKGEQEIAHNIIWPPGSGVWLQVSKVFKNRTQWKLVGLDWVLSLVVNIVFNCCC